MQDTSAKCLCGFGPNGLFGLKLSLISSLSRIDGNNRKGEILKELGEIKERLHDLCNLGLLKEKVTSFPTL